MFIFVVKKTAVIKICTMLIINFKYNITKPPKSIYVILFYFEMSCKIVRCMIEIALTEAILV